ncbi:MAG: D-glycero-beta-D-manno-heptose 1,7-bisphosphate 7-phosphatase [Planctomycetia bacterium]|nr:MAG: D-glycero-beta-D-manno-heptose 1,7-bisphosphate 7-phosphatase [Planctomycetia bacterium]
MRLSDMAAPHETPNTAGGPTWPAVFLDRDGVINVDKSFVFRVADFQFAEGVLRILPEYVRQGYRIIVVTNQSGIGRGLFGPADFHRVSAWMQRRLAEHGAPVTAVYHCPHLPEDSCLCRKPAPGLLLRAAEQHQIDLGRSWLVGDRETDIEAGHRAGVPNTILLAADSAATRAEHVCRRIEETLSVIPAVAGRSSADGRPLPALSR